MDLDDAKTSNSNDRTPDVGDLVDVYKLPPKKWVTLRFRKGIFSTARYWVKTKNKQGKETKFPTVCPSYDMESQDRLADKYDPWRDLQAAEYKRMQDGDVSKEEMREKAKVQYEQKFYMQAIVRGLQKTEPAKKPKHTGTERKTSFKDKDSDSWTPQRAIRLGKSFAEKLKKLKGLNTVESAKTGATKAFAIDDEKYGCDIRVMYDPDAAPADQYQVQIGERKALTEDELAYLGWDLESATEKAMTVADDKEVKRDFESWAQRNGVKLKKAAKKSEDDDADDSDDSDDDEDEAPKKSSKKPAAKKASKKVEEDDEDDSDSDDEDDEDEPPKKTSKKAVPAKKGKKPAEDDEDDFDEDDSDSDDDEDEPPKKGKKPAAKKAKDEDEDDFDDDSSDDDDEDEAPKKSSKKAAPAKKSSKKDEDEDDFDDDDSDDEDDEDEPPKKSAKKPVTKKAPAKKSKDEDEDDFDDDEDDSDSDDDDDEDEAPKKSSKKPAPAKKTAKKAKDEDDDEDF